jgi:SecD/SecF fusion protein
MQNKGAIRFFAIALAVVCIFQLSFTLITNNIEGNASDYATERVAKNKTEGINKDSLFEVFNKRYIDSISSVPVYNILLKNYTYRECKEKELNLGLDLRGGMNVISRSFCC